MQSGICYMTELSLLSSLLGSLRCWEAGRNEPAKGSRGGPLWLTYRKGRADTPIVL